MACALASALTGRKVRREVAMTGEVTLRGRVLPIGGVKEKVLAAHRAGIKKILLPAENKKDLDDVPVNIKNKLEFVCVESMDEVLEEALLEDKIEEEQVNLNNLPAIIDDITYQPERGPQVYS